MITVNIKGGLGNQMFQYACARALSLRNEDRLRLARSDYQGDVNREFSLLAFNINSEVVNTNSIPFYLKLINRVRQKLTRNFYVNFQPEVLKKKGNVYLDGYFQSEKYFTDFAEVIREDFELNGGLEGAAAIAAAQIQRDSHAVSLHVRRGDYVTHPDFGGIVTKEYYKRAIARITKEIPKAHLYIFSDEIDWCRENLRNTDKLTFVSQSDFKDYEELTLMSLCQHHIIANSSFSWWGAWLGKNESKIVIAPTRWANQNENWYNDIIPEKWIQI